MGQPKRRHMLNTDSAFFSNILCMQHFFFLFYPPSQFCGTNKRFLKKDNLDLSQFFFFIARSHLEEAPLDFFLIAFHINEKQSFYFPHRWYFCLVLTFVITSKTWHTSHACHNDHFIRYVGFFSIKWLSSLPSKIWVSSEAVTRLKKTFCGKLVKKMSKLYLRGLLGHFLHLASTPKCLKQQRPLISCSSRTDDPTPPHPPTPPHTHPSE